tara:strand:- start:2839 stop:3609 length:771 start_codon:yes stop_codon:yes gene_type:complete
MATQAEETLSYSEGSKGWPSFYSYIPEYMMGMNSYFYSFDGGNLYRHNTNSNRNNYYGKQYVSSLTGVFNIRPQLIKVFKTISFESTTAWECKELLTDLSGGSMLDTYFEEKEGEWFSYIRNKETTLDFKLRSANGIGELTDFALTSTPNTIALTFSVGVGNIISYGDKVYQKSGASEVLIGTVTDIFQATNKIHVLYTTLPTLSIGDFIFYYKNPVVESNGARGYFLQFEIELPSSITTPVELFSVGSSVMQSFP